MLNLKTYSLSVYFIIYILCQASYQQHFVFGFICTSTSGCDNDCTFCIGNHNTAMITTFKTFLQDAQMNCEHNIKSLIVLYRDLMSSSADSIDNCYNLLLRREIRKNLIKALKAESWTHNKELEQTLKYIYDIDKSAARIILEQAISGLWLSKEPEEVIKDIGGLKEKELKLMAFEFLFDKHLLDNEQAMTLIPLLTYHVCRLYNKRLRHANDSQPLYYRLPEELRIFYESSSTYSLFYNYSVKKNLLSLNNRIFDNNGLVAFTYIGSNSFKYLYVGHPGLTYGLSTAVKSNQWWHVILISAGYLMFCNDNTRELLCAEEIADEIEFTLLNYRNNMKNIACQWEVRSYARGIALVSAIMCATN